MNVRILSVCLLSAGLAGPVPAQEPAADGDIRFVSGSPERCLYLRSIDHTEVIDDYNVLFHMKGGDIYRNQLPHRCPGLGFRESFMYKTSLSQLCNVDIITVLEQYGSGPTPGASCGLGLFYPVTEADVKALKEDIERSRNKG